jgi:SAM-dependent methyltransferase
VSDPDRYRLSFDAVADVYERSRPRYAPDAIAWIAQRLPLGRVLDLGAGTGKLSRQLAERGADVVAVEPGAEMRAVLRRVLPGVEVLAGSAEAIPLPDESVDAVTAGQAFHWFRTGEALAEIHRVLRPGGGFALLWNAWDESDPLLAALNEIVDRLRPPRADRGEDEIRASPLFRADEWRKFAHADELTAEAALERVASVSAISAADPAERERALADVRDLLGTGTIRFPMITSVLAADRV